VNSVASRSGSAQWDTCAPDFELNPAVVNGFSDLIVDVYGEERGLCARSAIGVSELPGGIPVEVEAVVALG
jgi:hypothetical protein